MKLSAEASRERHESIVPSARTPSAAILRAEYTLRSQSTDSATVKTGADALITLFSVRSMYSRLQLFVVIDATRSSASSAIRSSDSRICANETVAAPKKTMSTVEPRNDVTMWTAV